MTSNLNLLFPLLDLTLLDLKATQSDISNLYHKANNAQVAAICIYPEHLHWLPEPCHLTKAIVVNFPEAQYPINDSLKVINTYKNHVQEIDYVFSYQSYPVKTSKLNNTKYLEALSDLEKIYYLCKNNNLKLKVILETGYFSDDFMIYQLSKDILEVGCNFLKTSTGKISQGATLEAAKAMLTAIKESSKDCGIKISGGIKSANIAFQYINLAENEMRKSATPDWFRIGASRLE